MPADNCQIFGFELSPEDDAAITAFLDEYPRLQGDCYTLERESPRYKSIIHMNVNEEEQGGNDALTSEQRRRRAPHITWKRTARKYSFPMGIRRQWPPQKRPSHEAGAG